MSVTFSESLVERYKRYMQSHHSVSLSSEQAQVHLASLSQLYISFSFPKTDGRSEEKLLPNPHPDEG